MSDSISRADAIEAIASRDETDGTVKVFTGREVNEILSALPSADRPTGEWISEELANMICDEICYYKEVTVDADSLNDLCEGCLIKKKKYGRPTGEWVLDPNGMDWNIPAWRCSECGFVANYIGVEANGMGKNPMNWVGSKFCPNCGAKMGSAK